MFNRLACSEHDIEDVYSYFQISSSKYAFNIGVTPVFNSEYKNVYADIRINFTYSYYLSRAIKPGEKTLDVYIVPQYSDYFSGAICAAQATRKNITGHCYAISPGSGETENWYIHNVLLPNTNFNIFHHWVHPSGFNDLSSIQQQIIYIKPYNITMERVQ